MERAVFEEFEKACFVFDKNGDGKLTTKQIRTLMRSLGENPTEMEVQEMIIQMDAKGSGSIDISEFCAVIVSKYVKSKAEEEIREAFRAFDKTGSGLVCAAELRYALTNLGNKMTNEEVDEIFGKVDAAENGQINYEELIKMMKLS